jgi:hypothetical protein
LIYISEKDVNCAIGKMNDELKNLVFWLKIYKLSLNLEETAYMLISNRNIESGNSIEMNNGSTDLDQHLLKKKLSLS